MPSLTEPLTTPGFWDGVLEDLEDRLSPRDARLPRFRELVRSGEALKRAGAWLGGARLAPPHERRLNREGQGRKKTVYLFEPEDDLLLRGLHHVLHPVVDSLLPDNCHAFRTGGSARSAFTALLKDPGLGDKACLRLDVRNYFNSIPPERLLARLPPPLAGDAPLVRVLEGLLLDPRVRREGGVVEGAPKGVMAGTCTAPLLANLYLREVDLAFLARSVTYGRYSDDLIVLDAPGHLAAHEAALREALSEAGLAVNEEKSGRSPPGEPWTWLGLRYHQGEIDLAPHTAEKLRARVRRLARRQERRKREPEAAVRRVLRRLDRKLYGGEGTEGELCWARWFFPVLTTDRTLRELDAVIQEKLRFVASGRYARASHRVLPYERMVALGYLPLSSAWHAWRDGAERYARLSTQRLAPARASARRG
jgi:hypothetical protein